jgi:AcrR family transcriptional regulator
MDELSSDLGMSKKTFYKFFPSKEELLRTIVYAMMKGVEREMERIENSDKPFAERIADVMVLLGKNVGRISRAFQLDIQRFAPALWKEVEAFRRDRIIARMGKMILKAREEGIFREEINEVILVHMLFHSIQGIVNPEFLTQQSFSLNEAFRTIFKTLFEGALTDEARKHFHKFDQPLTTTS